MHANSTIIIIIIIIIAITVVIAIIIINQTIHNFTVKLPHESTELMLDSLMAEVFLEEASSQPVTWSHHYWSY